MSSRAVAIRCLLGLFFLVTSLYSMLAYVPFAFQQVHKGKLIPALNDFGTWNHHLYWGSLVLAAVMFCLEPLPQNYRARLAMRMRAGFWVIHLPAGLYFSFRPVFAAMENSVSSYVWSLVMLEPILYLAAIVWAERWPEVRWASKSGPDDTRVFFAAWCSAVFLSYVYSAVGAWRGAGTLTASQCGFALLTSLMTHLLVFLALFVILNLTTLVSGWFPRPPLVQFFLCYGFGTLVFFLLIRNLVFPAISFGGIMADGYAACLGLAIAGFLSSISIGLRRRESGEIASGVALALWLPAPGLVRSWARIAATGLALAIAAASLSLAIAKFDWNYLFQKLTAMLIWVAVFRLFYTVAAWKINPSLQRPGRMLLIVLAVLPTYRIMAAAERSMWPKSKNGLTYSRFLDSYAGFDVSFKLMHDVLGTRVEDAGFYRFLSRNTNLPRSIHIEPAKVEIAGPLKPVEAAVPHIFVFVIDSLRRDYLSPYNSSVSFTPNLARFAAESVVMRNSYTRYGGTGLSEPSIWTGGAMIHQQYIIPFAPMNALQQLLQFHEYTSFISRDSILETVVSEWPKMKPLDRNYGTMDYDFCRSLAELEGNLDSATKGPIFAYTQAQNIHISVLNREGGKAIDNENYFGFHPPYASRLRRIDGCFGNFIQTLKTRGLYDSSVVVFTADHGDSLGEEGRWGHAYTIYPEILRVPLIIHLPVQFQGYHSNPDALAFNSDLTPTLYYLLGHRPIVKSELFGKPLFTETPEERNRYKPETYLVSSSYAAVYGILSGDGRFLYTADAVNSKDSWFDLTETTPAGRTVPSSMKAEYEKLIRAKIEAVSKFYNFTPLQ